MVARHAVNNNSAFSPSHESAHHVDASEVTSLPPSDAYGLQVCDSSSTISAWGFLRSRKGTSLILCFSSAASSFAAAEAIERR
jgi:hypothetical protein